MLMLLIKVNLRQIKLQLSLYSALDYLLLLQGISSSIIGLLVVNPYPASPTLFTGYSYCSSLAAGQLHFPPPVLDLFTFI